jgi:DNA polymerase I-like protein with 3'-5' exonuclease and polymerase domains
MLSAFRARTGRNQPSNAKFIFGPATWIRGLIKPAPGMGVAYIDWEQQEWGIAAALSGDEAMMAAYRSGDPYMAFAIQAGAAPREATKATHGHVRRLFKATVLAVQYGMGERALAEQLGVQPAEAKELLALHRRTYRKFWTFSDAVVEYAMLHHELWTTFGWRIHVGADANVRALRNFPMQANGAEMMRLACCLVTERGVKLCAPVHDALLIEAPVVEIDEAVASTREAMAEASRIVLGGFQLRTDVMQVLHPDRYMDRRGQKMWDKVWNIITKSKN